MSDLDSQLRDYVESTIERVDIDDVAAAASAGPTARPKPTLRRPVWIAAGAAVLVMLLIGIPLLFIGNGDSTTTDQTPSTASTPTVTPPTTQTVPATTLPPSPDTGEGTGTAAMVTPPIEATWTLAATIEGGWLTEPVAHNGGFLARHKALAKGIVEGWINTDEGLGGQLWESTDGVTWVPAGDDQPWPPSPTAESMTAPAVIVEYEGDRATERVGRLLATSDGSNWREINLRPYEDNWIPRVAEGGLGWLVYSPPRAAGAGWSSPRPSNHGLWYSPDTEAWFEATDLGPLAGYANVGDVGVWDVAMIVRDDDILFFAYIAENLGFGNGSQHRTEIWQLELGTARSTTDATPVADTAGGWVYDAELSGEQRVVLVSEWAQERNLLTSDDVVAALGESTTKPVDAASPEVANYPDHWGVGFLSPFPSDEAVVDTGVSYDLHREGDSRTVVMGVSEYVIEGPTIAETYARMEAAERQRNTPDEQYDPAPIGVDAFAFETDGGSGAIHHLVVVNTGDVLVVIATGPASPNYPEADLAEGENLTREQVNSLVRVAVEKLL